MTVIVCIGVCAINSMRSLCLHNHCASVEGEAATMSAVPYSVSAHGGGSTDMSLSGLRCRLPAGCPLCVCNQS